ncbi:MAG: TIGR02099 family protein [Gammaproteobacteria bacterium]|nr:TIGR02099 family protein [Gammaproteobacteria bacterium]
MHRIWSVLWLAIAVTVIATAVGLSAVRMLLAFAPEYREEAEAWVARALDRPVEIGRLEAVWRLLGPRVELRDVALHSRDGEQVLLRLDRVEIGIDVLASLRHRRLEPSALSVAAERLAIERRPDGRFRLQGFEQADPRRAELIALWLFSQPRINLQAESVHWRNARPGRRDYAFANVDIALRNDRARHQLDARIDLPPDLGRDLRVAVDVTGRALDPRSWSGRLHAAGEGLALGQWPLGEFLAAGPRLARGEGDVSLWSHWRDGAVEAVTAELDLAGLELASPAEAAQALRLERLAGRLRWRRGPEGWRLDAERLQLAREGVARPALRGGVILRRSADGPPGVAAAADRLWLEDAAALARASGLLESAAAEALATLRPRGRVSDLRLTYAGGPGKLSLEGRFEDLALEPWRRFPGAEGLDGELRLGPAGGRLVLETRAAQLDYPRLFRDVLPIAEARGTVRWARRDGDWRVHSESLALRNADGRGTVRFDLDWGRGAAPFLDLQAALRDGAVAAVPRYLPARVMPDPAVRWLDRALAGGRVSSGELLFFGPVKRFPFDRGEGRFEVRLDAAGVELRYHPDWPPLRGMRGEVVFEGRGLRVEGRAGEMYGARLSAFEAEIPNLARAVLEVGGRARGPLDDMRRYLAVMRRGRDYGELLETLRATGPAELELAIRLPIGRGPPSWEGTLGLEGASLHHPAWDLRLNDLSGALAFSSTRYRAESIRGRFRGRPVELAVRTEKDPGGPRYVVTAEGVLPVGALLDDPGRLGDAIQGASQVEVEVALPRAPAGRWPPRLTVRSDLRGLAVGLPAPLGKAAEEARALRVTADLSLQGLGPLRVDYDERLKAVLDIRWAEGRLERGRVQLGGAVPVLPSGRSLEIGGGLDRLAVGPWLETFAGGGDGLRLPSTTSVQLEVGELAAFGQRLPATSLYVDRTGTGWIVAVDSAPVAGRLQIGTRLSRSTVRAELSRCHLEPAEGRTDRARDPRSFPALDVHCGDLRYKGRAFGTLELVTRPRFDGLEIARMALSDGPAELQLSGNWRGNPGGREVTSLEGELQTADLGRVLARLGYVGAIKAESAHARLSLRWFSAPWDFDLATLNGEIGVRIADGRLLQVEPGAGRIFGLLSLQALPRRLSLDFSDMVKKGLAFDLIEGDFQLIDGDAYTNNLVMQGPSAYVRTRGRIGLLAEDYEQRVTVVPSVSSSLPIAGAIAGGPGVGAVLYLTQKLFKKEIEEITRYEYVVKGPWEAPRVERIEEPETVE